MVRSWCDTSGWTTATKAQGDAVNAGDLGAAERMLSAQAAALNAIFGELARRAALNMGEHLGAAETYMRLALKAQSQSRATIETLATIKNPPTVYARQVNVANGPQQVNNGAASRPLENQSTLNKLSRGTHELCQDTRASQATSRAHSGLEPVGAVDGPA